MAKLTYKQRKRLPKEDFVFPEKAPGPGSYPISDLAHARNALAMVSAFGSPAEKAKVRRKVYKKFPQLKKRASKRKRITRSRRKK